MIDFATYVAGYARHARLNLALAIVGNARLPVTGDRIYS